MKGTLSGLQFLSLAVVASQICKYTSTRETDGRTDGR